MTHFLGVKHGIDAPAQKLENQRINPCRYLDSLNDPVPDNFVVSSHPVS
jgi:hypothetical protein